MNVCSPIALNAISSENELIVYIEMMRTGGQTKTGTKRKRRKKKEAVYLFDEIEKRVKLMNVVAINVLAHALEHNKPEKTTKYITWNGFWRKKNTPSNRCVYSLKMRTLSNWNGHFSSIPIDTISDMNYLHYFSMSRTKKCSVFHNELPSQPLEKRERKKYLEQKSSNVKWLRGCWFWTSTKEVSWTHFSSTDSDKLLNFNIWSTMRRRWC